MTRAFTPLAHKADFQTSRRWNKLNQTTTSRKRSGNLEHRKRRWWIESNGTALFSRSSTLLPTVTGRGTAPPRHTPSCHSDECHSWPLWHRGNDCMERIRESGHSCNQGIQQGEGQGCKAWVLPRTLATLQALLSTDVKSSVQIPQRDCEEWVIVSRE